MCANSSSNFFKLHPRCTERPSRAKETRGYPAVHLYTRRRRRLPRRRQERPTASRPLQQRASPSARYHALSELFFIVLRRTLFLHFSTSMINDGPASKLILVCCAVNSQKMSGAALLSTREESRILLPEKKGGRKVDGNPRGITGTTNLAIGQA